MNGRGNGRRLVGWLLVLVGALSYLRFYGGVHVTYGMELGIAGVVVGVLVLVTGRPRGSAGENPAGIP